MAIPHSCADFAAATDAKQFRWAASVLPLSLTAKMEGPTMKCKAFCFCALCFLLLPLAVQAQVQPTRQLISFTGTMPGQPDGPVMLRFRLFPVASGGAACFEETQTVQVAAEKFSVFVGDAIAGGIPASPCFTENSSQWVAFALDVNPDTEIGVRKPITSSGFTHSALSIVDGSVTTPKIADGAVTAPKLAVNSVDSTKIVAGSVGAVAVNGAEVQLRVSGNCAAGNAIRVVNQDGTAVCEPVGAGGGIGGSGTTNQIAKFTSSMTIGSSGISEVGGNVGIGTLNPLDKLSVQTTAENFGVIHTDGNIAVGTWIGAGSSGVDSGWFGTKSNHALRFFTGNSSAIMTIHTNRNIGIGTTEPTLGKLQVISPTSEPFTAVWGESTVGEGVRGQSNSGNGIVGLTRSDSAGSGVVGVSLAGGAAGRFRGNVEIERVTLPDGRVTGTLSIGELPSGTTPLCLGSLSRVAFCSSSIRYKEQVENFTSGLELMGKLRPITFRWKEGGEPDLGLIAEEVSRVEPLLVTHNKQGNIEGVKYDRLSAVLINAVQQQQAQIAEQHRTMAKLQQENRDLRARFAVLERLIQQAAEMKSASLQ